jgi:hypothetical protein
MKIRTFFIASLFFPYFLWMIAKGISINSIPTSSRNNAILELPMEIFNVIYVSGIWVWAIPYTVLVIGLIKWSKNKSGPELQKTVLFAPLLLSLLVAIEIIIAALLLSALDGMQSFLGGLGGISLVAPFIYLYIAIVVTPTGYIFAFFSLAMLKFLIHFRVIKADEEMVIP